MKTILDMITSFATAIDGSFYILGAWDDKLLPTYRVIYRPPYKSKFYLYAIDCRLSLGGPGRLVLYKEFEDGSKTPISRIYYGHTKAFFEDEPIVVEHNQSIAIEIELFETSFLNPNTIREHVTRIYGGLET